MFPPSNASIDRNDAGEVTGWDVPAEPAYCETCGATYNGLECPFCAEYFEDPDDDEDDEDDEFGFEKNGVSGYEL